jgi:hypothetical protein
MGAVYGFLAPEPEQPRRPGTWQTFDITMNGRWVTVVQNGKTIINNKEIPGITGGALDSHEELPTRSTCRATMAESPTGIFASLHRNPE